MTTKQFVTFVTAIVRRGNLSGKVESFIHRCNAKHVINAEEKGVKAARRFWLSKELCAFDEVAVIAKDTIQID